MVEFVNTDETFGGWRPVGLSDDSDPRKLNTSQKDAITGSAFEFDYRQWMPPKESDSTDDYHPAGNTYAISIKLNSEAGSLSNSSNNLHKKKMDIEFKNSILNILLDNGLEYGVSSEAEKIIESYMAENQSVTREWLNQLFIDYFYEKNIVLGLLNMMSHFSYDDMLPEGPTMAIAALASSDIEIKEAGIRAFENWNSPESVNALQSASCEHDWLDEYRVSVIEELKR